MAEEQDTSQERTEEPTEKRRRDVREKGQVPRSRELNAVIALILSAASCYFVGQYLVGDLMGQMRASFTLSRQQVMNDAHILAASREATVDAMIALAPWLAIAAVTLFIGPVAMGGWIFKLDSVLPKLEKINPVKGLGRLFGAQGLMELVKAVLKFVLVTTAAAIFIYGALGELLALGRSTVEVALRESGVMVSFAFVAFSSVLILLALADVPFQLHQHTKRIRMTRQEVKDEMKETEGRPEVKGRVRQLQQEMSRARMMQAVPTADVVITNPTHYAVALKYEDGDGAAPVVVAKGKDEVAFRIIALAREHGVSVFQAPPLARALYASTELRQEIPGNLYVAVAQVLAYIYQLRRLTGAEAATLTPPDELDIPDEYRNL